MTTEETGGRCPNCSTPLSGPFCSSCGQRQLDLDRPFREILSEATEAFFDFDTRIVRTLRPLITRPGFLTLEFFQGRRARYVHPFKLYFAFSVLLFVVLSMSSYVAIRVSDTGNVVMGAGELEEGASSPENDAEIEQGPDTNTGPVTFTLTESGDLEADADDEEDSFLSRVFGPLGDLMRDDPDRLNQLFTDRLAKSIIVLVPVFALLLRFLYWKVPYIKQLVFSLHLHSFAFLVIPLGIGIDMAMGAEVGQGWGNLGATLAIIAYSFLALRRAYGQGRLRTGVKMVAVMIGYLLSLITTMIMTLIVTALTI